MIIKILQIICILFFVAFCMFNILMHFKPIIAFSLFIKDFIKLDKHQFRGFGFWLFCGLGGSGKTLSMVEYMTRMKKRYPNIKVYTNFEYELSDGLITSWKDILNLENFELLPISQEEYMKTDEYNRVEHHGIYYKKYHHGIIFGFDEIHLTFASQNWQDCPDNMLDYISQQRKLHKQIVASSQVFTRVDKKLREQTNFVVECKSVFMGRWVFNKYFNTCEYLANDEKGDAGARKRRRAKRYNFVAYDSIRNLYNTMQVMKTLTPKKTSQIFIEEILKNMGEK